MSEALLYDISQQLAFIAGRSLCVDAEGRVLRGVINPVIDQIRRDVLDVLYAMQDGTCCRPLAQRALNTAQAIIACHRQEIRELRRAAAIA